MWDPPVWPPLLALGCPPPFVIPLQPEEWKEWAMLSVQQPYTSRQKESTVRMKEAQEVQEVGDTCGWAAAAGQHWIETWKRSSAGEKLLSCTKYHWIQQVKIQWRKCHKKTKQKFIWIKSLQRKSETISQGLTPGMSPSGGRHLILFSGNRSPHNPPVCISWVALHSQGAWFPPASSSSLRSNACMVIPLGSCLIKQISVVRRVCNEKKYLIIKPPSFSTQLWPTRFKILSNYALAQAGKVLFHLLFSQHHRQRIHYWPCGIVADSAAKPFSGTN